MPSRLVRVKSMASVDALAIEMLIVPEAGFGLILPSDSPEDILGFVTFAIPSVSSTSAAPIAVPPLADRVQAGMICRLNAARDI